VSQIKRGILDIIGSARPSIADPFLPRKIDEGRLEDIRECIGCNICVASYNVGGPINCTQNPTIGEEHKRGWHPERYRPAASKDRVLIVGAGPAGLECAQALGHRGYDVSLVEASRELGGRVTRESRLKGLAEWARVRDWRVGQIDRLSNVATYRESRMTAQDVVDFGAPVVVIATGARWRRDGFGRNNWKSVPTEAGARVFTPDDVMDGAEIAGPVVVFDDDDFYMGGVVAETLKASGVGDVALVTPSALASAWTVNTLEQAKIQKRLIELGVAIVPCTNLKSIGREAVELACMFTERQRLFPAASTVLVTARLPEMQLHAEIGARMTASDDHGIRSLRRIGDCIAPGTIAYAVFDGRRAAEELDEPASSSLLKLETERVDLVDLEGYHRRHAGRTRSVTPRSR
jgi:dimethylamine/trimethylamine dehydrogenase